MAATLCLWSWPGGAAEPNQNPLAEELFNRGRELLAAGDLPAACAALAESQRLDPALGTLLNLAVCHEREGRVASAWAEFLQAASEARRQKQDERADYAARKARELEPQVPRLQLVLTTNTSALHDLQVQLDGKLLGRAAWSSAIPLDPGAHHLRVSAPGRPEWQHTFEISAGGAPLTVQVPEVGPARSVPAPAAKSEAPTIMPTPRQAPTNTSRVAGFGLAGAGVIGLGVAGYFGLRAIGHKGDRDRECSESNVCSARGVQLDEQARDAASAANVAAVVGALLVGGGITILLLSPSETESASLRAHWRATGSGSQVLLSGQF